MNVIQGKVGLSISTIIIDAPHAAIMKDKVRKSEPFAELQEAIFNLHWKKQFFRMKYIKLVIFLFVVASDVVTLGSPVAKEGIPQGYPALIKVEKREAPADCCFVCRSWCTCCYA